MGQGWGLGIFPKRSGCPLKMCPCIWLLVTLELLIDPMFSSTACAIYAETAKGAHSPTNHHSQGLCTPHMQQVQNLD